MRNFKAKIAITAAVVGLGTLFAAQTPAKAMTECEVLLRFQPRMAESMGITQHTCNGLAAAAAVPQPHRRAERPNRGNRPAAERGRRNGRTAGQSPRRGRTGTPARPACRWAGSGAARWRAASG